MQRYGVARWGLYALIKDAKDYDLILPRYADFSYEGDLYPLAPDPGGPWLAYSNGCELFFSHPYWGRLPLLEFVDVLNWRAENWANTSGKGWRPNTLQFHWYETGGRFYSDFYKQWALPDLKMVGFTIKALGGVEVLSIQDRYGNEYMSVGGSIGPAVALGPEAWEGYARTHIAEPGRLDGEAPSESVLRDNIIQGFSIGVTGVLVNTGIGFSFGRAGSIGLFTDAHTQLGISFSAGHTWLTSTRRAKGWNWVDTEIPGYSFWEALDDK